MCKLRRITNLTLSPSDFTQFVSDSPEFSTKIKFIHIRIFAKILRGALRHINNDVVSEDVMFSFEMVLTYEKR